MEGRHGRRDCVIDAHHANHCRTDRHADDVKNDKRPASTSEAMVARQDEGDAEPGHHRLLDRLVRSHLDAEIVDAAGYVREKNLKRDARAGARLANEECSSATALGDVARRRHRMIGRRDNDQRMVAKGRGADRHILRRPTHQRDVDIVVLQAGDRFGAVADGEPHVDVGIFLHEGGHQGRREIFRRSRRRRAAGCRRATPLIASI